MVSTGGTEKRSSSDLVGSASQMQSDNARDLVIYNSKNYICVVLI